MSVYTELSESDVAGILKAYDLGRLQAFAGIAAGIENSNFFVDTDVGRFVLTVFERMSADELPYFMHLMHHLSARGCVCPDVMRRSDGSFLFDIMGKKGAVVSCLPGRTLDALSDTQLYQAGRALAELHHAGADFPMRRENSTGCVWVRQQVAAMQEDVAVRYGNDVAELLADEVHWQAGLDASIDAIRMDEMTGDELPRGVIHGDLFCDNILFNDASDGDVKPGIIDFYYAHDAFYVMDIAISLNALAIRLQDDDAVRSQHFLNGYASLRPLTAAETSLLPGFLRRAALRFWVSRLFDALYPRAGATTTIKDPEEYRLKLLHHRGSQ
ncbi:MAG: homoserine kinase [Mariprofundaceae bacterium]|nr:homoserine kinase [Mariprofundaceae bacterium]